MMVDFDYVGKILESVEFIIAFGSLIGFLMLIVGVLGLLLGNKRTKAKCYYLVFFSVILLAICGFNTGLRYFRIFP